MHSNKNIQINYKIEESSITVNIFNKTPVETEQIVEITNEKNEIVYSFIIKKVTDEFIKNGSFNFCSFTNSSKDINIKIYEKGVMTFQESVKIRNKYNNLIGQPKILVGPCGMGDSFYVQPVIRKLNNIFGRKIDVYSEWCQPFVNNPHVNNFTKINNCDQSIFKKIKEENKNHSNFWNLLSFDGVSKFYKNVFLADNRDVSALHCGPFSLNKNEKYFEFYPDKKTLNYLLPEKYILIYPRILGPDRDFGRDGWQKLIELLNSKNIPIVLIGLNHNDNKDYHDLNVQMGVNLCGKIERENQSEFQISSDIWHLINNAFGVITFPTSTNIIAGTTDTNIFLIESYFDNNHWNSYRKGMDYYKFFRIGGECFEKCISNAKYYIEELSDIRQFRVQQCPLGKNFSCVPNVEKVANEVIREYYKLCI